MDEPTGILLQYGAIGVMALASALAARVMFLKLQQSHDRETEKLQQSYDRERERADRLESELRSLNEMVRTKYVETITLASQAVSDAISTVRRG